MKASKASIEKLKLCLIEVNSIEEPSLDPDPNTYEFKVDYKIIKNYILFHKWKRLFNYLKVFLHISLGHRIHLINVVA